MIGELRFLLESLSKSEREGFQGITIHPNGTSRAVFRFGCKTFETLDDLHNWLYPPKPEQPKP